MVYGILSLLAGRDLAVNSAAQLLLTVLFALGVALLLACAVL
jgi:hypothetical protein